MGRDHPSVGGATMQMTIAAGGLGHALSVGAFGCDLCGGRVGTRFQEARWEVSVVFNCGRLGFESHSGFISCNGKRKSAKGTGTLGAGPGELLLRSLLVGEFLIFLSSLPAKVIDPAVGEVDHDSCARRGGCPGKCARLGLRRLDGILMC
ncbi:hypothetical protein CDL15_Pgr012253 [Punica granatum]|uniref:Uncharacterized protein n=1 Tax=Punica granatum TaxID=22663 RepID=A0A218WRM9_PUNGR|nr:hypothetical protein CDL15_Pgr012253 [Punica granatum]